MLTCDGEFLVRESSNKAGQFVLSGMKSGLVVHLLLVDPEGVVSSDNFIISLLVITMCFHIQTQNISQKIRNCQLSATYLNSNFNLLSMAM